VFVVGDVLGRGVYALIGTVGAETGGAIWVAFVVALALAIFTAFAYAELVTKYPRAAGAALYVNKAFRKPFVSFMVAFAVMASGITSAATLSRAFGGDYLSAFINVPTVLAALVFIAIVALINSRGIAESIKLNLVLTTIEVGGLISSWSSRPPRSASRRPTRAAPSTSRRGRPSSGSPWAARRSPSTRSWASRTR
jgi:amino acid transporter